MVRMGKLVTLFGLHGVMCGSIINNHNITFAYVPNDKCEEMYWQENRDL